MSFEDVKLFRIENGTILKAVSDSYSNLIDYYPQNETELNAITGQQPGERALVAETGDIWEWGLSTWTKKYNIFSLEGEGPAGPQGNGIVSILRTDGTGLPGSVDTYTITYDNAGTDTFTVYNGANGADGQDGTDGTDGTDGNTILNGTTAPTAEGVDGDFFLDTVTYMLYGPKALGAWGTGTLIKGADGADGTDGTDGVDGRGIVSVTRTSGDGSPGTTDTYTITYDKAPLTSTFDVYNGADGTGTLESVVAGDNIDIDNADPANPIVNLDATSKAKVDALVQEVADNLDWNADEYTVEIDTGLGPIIQIGQETVALVYNNTGVAITNGSVLHPNGATTQAGVNMPTVELADASLFDTCQGTLIFATSDIPNNSVGFGTRFGKVRGVDTSGFTGDGQIWLSATTPGAFTFTAPEFPAYQLSLGGAINADAVNGEIFASFTGDVQNTIRDAFDGGFRETFNFLVTSDGATITGTLENVDPTADLTMIFSGGLETFDTTSGATISLVGGTATNPQNNYIYIPKSTKVLTVSTTEFPADEHIKVAFVVLKDAASTQTYGPQRNTNWNDHLKKEDDNGHILHIAERIRTLPAKWESGTTGTITINGTSDVDLAVATGKVFQLHRQTFPAFDTATGDFAQIVNDFTTPYKPVSNLGAETTDALGNTLANSSFSFVVWGVQSKTGEISQVMVNLPTGKYAKNSPEDAIADASNYSVYDIPNDYNGAGFLIARFTYTLDAGGTTWTLEDTQDLRGKIPNTTAGGGGGGGGGVTEFTALSDTPSAYTGAALSLAQVNAGENALEFTSNPTINNTNISATTDKNYVTDAEKTIIGNTSGTNTGDQTIFGRSGDITAQAGDYEDGEITAAASATNYTPTAANVEGHLEGIDTALGAAGGGFTSGCSVYLSSNQSFGDGAINKILFDRELFDTDGEFDSTTNHRFTSTNGGIYSITGLLRWQDNLTSGATFQIMIRVNGVDKFREVRRVGVTSNNNGNMVAGIYKLTAGQYIELYATQTGSSASRNITGGVSYYTNLTIQQIA